MNIEIPSIDKVYFEQMKSRDYKCPCGKAYLSYAALFTHIKQKHNGKPPGNIIKPSSLNTKRGRPPLKCKKQNQNLNNSSKKIQFLHQQQQSHINQSDYYENLSQNHPQQQQQNSLQQIQKKQQSKKWIQQIAMILQQIPEQNINKQHLSQIQAFTQMTVIIARNQSQPYLNGTITLADGLIKFFRQICPMVSWIKFQQLYVMFMIYLQFIIDEENDKMILKSTAMEVMCDYVNDFYENHLMPMAEYYKVEEMGIFTQGRALNVFNCLFSWMMARGYTTYRIGLRWDMKKQQTTQLNFQYPEKYQEEF